MIKINLIPVEQRKSIEGMGQFLFGMFIIALVVAFMVALIVMQNNKIEQVKDETARVEKRIKELDEIRKKVEDFKKKNQELEKRIKVIAQLEKNRVGPVYVMDALSDVIPEKLWINDFRNKGNRASFSGISANEFIIADFMRNLQKNEHFTYANVGTIKNRTVSRKPFKSFTMSVGLKFGKAIPQDSNDKSEIKKQSNSNNKIKKDNNMNSAESEVKENTLSEGLNVIEDSKNKQNNIENNNKKEEKKQATPSEKVGTDDGSNVIVF